MHIESERAKATWYNGCGGPPACDYDAEIEVHDGDEIIYISASDCCEGLMFAARHVSVFDELENEANWANMKPIEDIEAFDGFEETKKSKYAKYYAIAKRMIDDFH